MSKVFIFIVSFFLLTVFLRVGLFFAFPLNVVNGESIHFTATIFDDPKIVGSREEIKLRYGNFWHSTPVSVVTSSKNPFFYGDTITVSGKVAYALLNNKQKLITLEYPQIKARKGTLLPVFAKIRQEIIVFCEKIFSQPYSGLLAGMLLGVKNTLSSSLTISFRITGVSHVVAASGMNVTLIAGFLIAFFGRVLKRRTALGVSIVGIVGYMILSGLDPSILRAGVMGILVFGSQLFGRQYTVVYSLFLTTGVLLIYDPLLITDVGFQLSVLATIGIIFLKPLVPLKGFFIDDIGTTLAAQLATLPILLSTFGSYGMLSILVNALVLWTIPIITILGSIGITLGFIFQPIGKIVLWTVFPLLWYFEKVVTYFAGFNSVITISQWPIFLSVGYYMMLLGVFLLFRPREKGGS